MSLGTATAGAWSPRSGFGVVVVVLVLTVPAGCVALSNQR